MERLEKLLKKCLLIMSLALLSLWLLNIDAPLATGSEMFAIESGWTAEEPGYYMTDEFARDVVAGWRTDKADKETYKRASECYHAQWQAALSDLNSTIATFEQAQETEPEEAPQSDYAVTIDGSTVTTDYEGNPALVVNYTWTNNSDEATSFAVAFDETCFQNGVEREMAIVSDVDTSNYMNEVQPGSTAEVTLCYELEDESEVTVEVRELFSLDDTVLAEKTFDPATL